MTVVFAKKTSFLDFTEQTSFQLLLIYLIAQSTFLIFYRTLSDGLYVKRKREIAKNSTSN